MLGPAGKTVNSTPTFRDRVRDTLARWHRRWGLRPFVWAGLLALLALALDFVPLYDVLGYDFAFAMGFGVALAGVDIGQGVLARARAALGRAPAGGELARVFGEAAVVSAATLVLPLLLGLGQ